MKTLSARIAGLSRLTKTLLAAGGALLALVIIAGVALAMNPALSARLTGKLAGEAANIVYPPGWVDIAEANKLRVEEDKANTYKLQPAHAVNTSLWLTHETFYFVPTRASWVELWEWDTDPVHIYNRLWRFTLVDATEGYFNIWTWDGSNRSSSSMHYLAVYNDSKSAGADVIVWTQAGGNNHQWKLIGAGGGAYQIQSRSSGLCLAIRDAGLTNGSALIQTTCDSTQNNQRWGLYRTTYPNR